MAAASSGTGKTKRAQNQNILLREAGLTPPPWTVDYSSPGTAVYTMATSVGNT